MTLRIAYHTGEYPRATDTFIQREVAALRKLGVTVETFTVRRTGREHLVGQDQRDEAERTFVVQEAARNPLRLIGSHAGAFVRSPARYARAAAQAWRIGWPGLSGRLLSLAYFAEAGELAAELRRRGIRHVHNHFANSSCSVATLASTMGGIGLSFTMHGPAIFFEPAKWRIDAKIAQARFVACISHFCRSQAMIYADPVTWPKLHVVHCGVEPDRYRPRTHTDPPRQVLFVGRLAAVKGLPMLLDAWAALADEFPDTTLKLVGDGPDRAMLERRVRDRGLADRVVFTGYQSQAQVGAHLAETDLFVMASFAEGVPVVLMEALAAGVPAVATRIAGVGELVEDGVSGLLVPPGDGASLAEAMRTLLSDASMRQRFGAAGRARVEAEFDVSREAAKLRGLFAAARGEAAATPPEPSDESEPQPRPAAEATVRRGAA